MYYLLTGKHPLNIKGQTIDEFKLKIQSIGPQDWDYPAYISK